MSKSRVALVTGSTSGIGLAIVQVSAPTQEVGAKTTVMSMSYRLSIAAVNTITAKRRLAIN